jgi:hypothetical protein
VLVEASEVFAESIFLTIKLAEKTSVGRLANVKIEWINPNLGGWGHM